MKYCIKPLQSLADFLTYFEERAKLNRKFAPDFRHYYLDRYEIDAFDSQSLHLGIFEQENKKEKLIGFSRISVQQPFVHTIYPYIPDYIRELLAEAEAQLPQLHGYTPLPCYQHYRFWGNRPIQGPISLAPLPLNIMEIGRMVVLREDAPLKLALNLIIHTLSCPIYLGAPFTLVSTSPKHQRFYTHYIGGIHPLYVEYKYGPNMVASVLDLKHPLHKGQNQKEFLRESFEQARGISAIPYVNHQVQIPEMA